MGYRPPEREFQVGLDIEDEALRQSLAAAIDRRAGLRLVDPDLQTPMVVVIDRPGLVNAATRLLTIAESGLSPVLSTGSSNEPADSFVIGSDAEVAVSAAHLVAAGYLVVPMAGRAGFGSDPPRPPPDVALTPREVQVLELLVAGASNKLIARRLGISVHTAKFHVTAVIDKLHARNRSDAVGIALRSGLVAL